MAGCTYLLIAENRALRRQLARTAGAAGATAGAGAERTLREIQRRVLQAVSPARGTGRSRAGTRRRQAGGAPPAPRRRPRGDGEDAG